jgi:hypothetical protein
LAKEEAAGQGWQVLGAMPKWRRDQKYNQEYGSNLIDPLEENKKLAASI